jgi:hypothetical protein
MCYIFCWVLIAPALQHWMTRGRPPSTTICSSLGWCKISKGWITISAAGGKSAACQMLPRRSYTFSAKCGSWQKKEMPLINGSLPIFIIPV